MSNRRPVFGYDFKDGKGLVLFGECTEDAVLTIVCAVSYECSADLFRWYLAQVDEIYFDDLNMAWV